MIGRLLPLSSVLLLLEPAAEAAGLDGASLYERRCGACHTLDAHRVGPSHRGVVGRRAGALADYNYSSALTQSDVVWTVEILDAWLADPEAVIPGQKMGYRLRRADERAVIIDYLATAAE